MSSWYTGKAIERNSKVVLKLSGYVNQVLKPWGFDEM